MTSMGHREGRERSFAYTVYEDGSGVVLYMSGVLDDAAKDELASAVSPYCDGPLVLDMDNISLVTGGCVRVLIAASQLMKDHGHTPRIHRPPAVLERVLEVCEAERFFSVTK